ncbi:MAG: hypothetical protein MSA02_06235 [Bacteroidales bacterium]|nr:hypothetical protein [Bacteroidales bacterium]
MALVLVSCSSTYRMDGIRRGMVTMGLSVPQDMQPERDTVESIKVDSIKGTMSDGPIIMNAIRDTDTGEMVATDVISASKVTARFRNVAERLGYVSIEFDISVPPGMSDSNWKLKIFPVMMIASDTTVLDPLFITGKNYRARQMRGYQRYRNFIASIISDTTDFIRVAQLEIFLKRNFPQTYKMKTDSSFVSEPQAMDLFGVTQEEALRHYTRQLMVRLNESRKARKSRMYAKYVRDPIVKEGIRLDTVLVSDQGEFTYRYVHTFRSRPRLKKVVVTLNGELYENGEKRFDLPFDEPLTYYISSLSSLADKTPKYRIIVLERMVRDNTKVLVDFQQGKAVLDTAIGDNASELRRLRKCIDDVASRNEFDLDSLVIIASCSPEGPYKTNSRLSAARSETMRKYISDYVPDEWKDRMVTAELPENWPQLKKLVASDTLIEVSVKEKIHDLMDKTRDYDLLEKKISTLSTYRYLREKIYPKLRSVSFDFHLHRVGMVKDTVHTSELDTVYMSGLRALEDLDYKEAVRILRPYADYNAALALMAADYNHTALELLNKMKDDNAKVCYLKAVLLARSRQMQEAMKYLELSIAYDQSMEYRANLDPELDELIKQRNTF